MPTSQVAITTLVRGFDEAHERLTLAISNRNTPAEDVFLPLFEALNWAVALSDLAREVGVSIAARSNDQDALRFARNRVHHQ